MREREKKKQEEEQDAAMERLKKEREQRKKKEEEDSLTLEQTKEQISELDKKLGKLKDEKHELFSRLKKVLHEEDNSKKKQQMREQSEMLSLQQQYPAPHHAAMFMTGIRGGSSKYLQPVNHVQPGLIQAGIKRSRSPSPPPQQPAIYAAYDGRREAKYAATGAPQKPAGSSFPVSQPNHAGHPAYQPAAYTSQAGSRGSSSAFTSYPSHYSHQKGLPEHYQGPGYSVQRQGYLSSPASAHSGSSLPLQQQLEHANQKSGFSEEKFKLQQHQQQLRGLAPGQVLSLQAGHPPSSTAQPKGSIITGYPVHTQAPTQQGAHSSPPGAPRQYTGTQPARYY